MKKNGLMKVRQPISNQYSETIYGHNDSRKTPFQTLLQEFFDQLSKMGKFK